MTLPMDLLEPAFWRTEPWQEVSTQQAALPSPVHSASEVLVEVGCRSDHCDLLGVKIEHLIPTKPQLLGALKASTLRHFQTPGLQGHRVSAKILHRDGASAQLEPLTLQLHFFRSQSCGVAWDLADLAPQRSGDLSRIGIQRTRHQTRL